MSDDFQQRLDQELGTTLDAIAADKARALLAARLAAEQSSERLAQAKAALDALVVPRMQALAAKLGLRAARIGETDRAGDAAGWYCAIPLELVEGASLAAYDGDIIATSITPQPVGAGFAVCVWSCARGDKQTESRDFQLTAADKTEAQLWIDERLIRAAQRQLGIEYRG